MLSRIASKKISKQIGLNKKIARQSSSINKVIQDLLETSSKEESDLRVSQFAKNLDYLREKHEERSKIINQYLHRMRAASINSNIPLKEILRQFISSTRLGFDQKMTSETLFYLSATLNSLGPNPNHYFDYNLELLKDSWRFDDLVGDFRYGLKSGVEFSPERIAQGLRSLKKLGYSNSRITREAIQKIHRMLTKNDDQFNIDTENIIDNNPSIHKPLYYMRSPLDAKQIVENPEFQKFLKATIQKQEQELNKLNQKKNLQKDEDAQTITLRNELNEEEQEILDEIEIISKKINKSIQKSALAMKKTIESVIQIRRHYLRMIESQEKVQSVNLTPQLNLDLLNLEESMVEAGLISINEVKNPQLIIDTNQNRESIAQIVSNLIVEQNESFLPYFDNLIQSKPQLLQEIDSDRSLPEINVQFFANYTHSQFAEALLAVTEYSNSKLSEFKGQTFLNEKWADFFPQVDEADRLFFVQFLDSQKLFIEVSEVVLEQTKNEKDVNALGKYAAAFGNIGLIGVSKELVKRITSLEGMSTQTGICILRVCSEFPEEFSQLSENIIQILEKSSDITASQAIDLVYYEIALNKVSEASLNILKQQSKHILDENPRLNYVSQYLKLQGVDLGYNASGASIFENNLFQKNPIKDKLVELIGKAENLSHTGLGDYKPDFMCLERNEQGEIVQKAIFITPAEYSYFDIAKPAVEYTLLSKYLSHKVKNMVFEFIPITKFIDVNHQDHMITIKRDNQLFIELFDKAHHNIYSNLNNDLLVIGENLIDEEYNILKSKIKQIFRLSGGRRYLQLSVSDLMQVKYSLFSMAEDFNTVLSETSQQNLNQLCQKHFNQDFVSLLKSHSKLNFSVKNTQEEMEFFLKQKWVGKRLSIDLLPKGNEKYNQSDAFFDHLYISSENYYEYPEWQELLTQEYGVSNIAQINPTNFLAHQVSDVCNQTNTAYIIPKKKEVRSQIRPLDQRIVTSKQDRANYSLTWEQDYFTQGTNGELVYRGENHKISEGTKYIANLLNFKWELKKAFSSQERLDFLHKLNLTDKLIENHLHTSQNHQPKHAHFAQRDPKKYFEYLQNKTPSSLYCQEYLEFFTRKVDQKNKIIQLSKLHFTKIKEIYKSYQKGYISRQQFDQQKEGIQKDLLKTLRQYDAANNSLDSLLQNETIRYIDVQFDAESLLKDKSYVRYNLENDRDYLACKKDLNQTLNLKRIRAEEKLIKAKILSKISAEQTLTSLEQQYLEKWNSGEITLPKEPTFLTYKELDNSDVQLLNSLKFSDLVSFDKMQVNDLVVEFSSLFEQAIINNADVHLKGKNALKEWGISPEWISKSATNSMNNYLIALSETQAWKDGQKLKEHEKENVCSMLRLLQEQSYQDKIFTANENVLRKEALDVFNQSENRFSIFMKWLESREQEGFSISSDNTEHVLKLWENIFEKSYENTTQEELHLFTHNLVQRLYVLSKYPPSAFGSFLSKLLLHPKLHIIDKNILICGIDAFKFNAYLSSKELIDFSRNVRAAHTPQDLAALTRANVFASENILQKISKLVKN
ncbi:hypothetical protein TTHERM_00145010 (macronuclear) [Tetrahymena thermophila SB210]|uniref:Uncharacterized protein n=1 Tax=Tetrahymena thermophila (strain SB210) TaxID=312017 RepID=I7M7B1_TETTS|nr:hypothetical protein TTHERM_00145010 [Tetrahymena thermophila SB210]EAR90896.2 hypothetical protein TTHERM_00145010 [Tetrahymena thermophila SB210]6Z1P_BJ Chain BJ, mS78 [Tetrahymena thermophila SB210]|eukprot:XP_001011141.2 hypothetical protein TTHERM_00145010 [Tetrahymena thermophila SB210]